MTEAITTAERRRESYWTGALAWSLAIGIAYVTLAIAIGTPVTVALAYNAAGIGAVAAGLLAARRTRSDVLLWLTIGMSCWVFGDVVWDTWDLRYGEAPYPSLIEIFYFAYFPFTAWGILRIRRQTGHLHRRFWGFLVAALAAAWMLLGAALVNAQDASGIAKAAAIALNAGDAAMLCLFSYSVLQRPWPVPRWLPYLFGSLAMFAGGDMLYGYSSTRNAFDAGGLADFLMVGGAILFTLCVSHPAAASSVVDDA